MHGFRGLFANYGLAIAHRQTAEQTVKTNHVLLVDVDRERLQALQRIMTRGVEVDAYDRFAHARRRLLHRRRPPDLLVTNGRLGPYNGLHLAFLAATFALPTRVVLYHDEDDVVLALEAQRAGAFFVHGSHVAAALSGYVNADLPVRDRRDVRCPDRRRVSRGGRRAADEREGVLKRDS